MFFPRTSLFLALLSLAWVALSCGDSNIVIPGCEECPERCLQNDNARARCVTCIKDEQCQSDDSPTKKCNQKNECVCGSDDDCAKGSRCSAERGCVACLSDEHCTSKDRPVCALDNTCVICKPHTTEGCIPKDSGACVPGTRTCKASGQWGPCEGAKACQANEKCVDKKCISQCPPAPCKEGDKQCTTDKQSQPGKYRQCVKDKDGCLGWSDELKSCKDKEVCHSQQCQPYECPATAECTLAQSRCVDATSSQTCTKDDNGCPVWGKKEACPSPQKCRSGLQKCTPCEPGLPQPCYSGPANTQDVGVCKAGTHTCKADGSGFSACEKEITPGKELCDGKDDDCDGQTDEGCDCIDGQKRSCFSGSKGCTASGGSFTCKGTCRAGEQSCKDGKWGACTGEVLPAAKEKCDGLDDDCSGTPDEGCNCLPNQTQACGSDTGECKKGTQTCDSTGNWGPCLGEVKATAEVCDGKDNDCNGKIDELFPDKGKTCSAGVGACQRSGSQRCKSDGSGLECDAAPGPKATETCNGKDDDCDGAVDESLSKSCYRGPANTQGVGVCKAGQSFCNNGAFGACVGATTPGQEICANQKDDDCDGTTDETSGRALQFKGGSDQISIPHHSSFDLRSTFTVEMWYYLDGLGNRNIALLLNKHKANENTNGYHFKIQNENGTPTCAFSWWNGNGGNQLLFGACPLKTWTHIAMQYDSSSKQYRFYTNGKLAAQGNATLDVGANNHPLLFGAETPPTQPPVSDVKFRGQLAAFRISSSLRYSATFTPACTWTTDASTSGLWNVGDGFGSQLKDGSSGGRDATITGATWTTGRSCNAGKHGGCVP